MLLRFISTEPRQKFLFNLNFIEVELIYNVVLISTVQQSDTCIYSFLSFLGLLPWHMEVPRLGVQSELQPLTYATATATPDPSFVCDLHHSSQQRRTLNSPSKARDRTHNLTVLSRTRQPLHHNGNSQTIFYRMEKQGPTAEDGLSCDKPSWKRM